jgi:ubiquinone/menaquinone biosynthesis C-methylase UbiE
MREGIPWPFSRLYDRYPNRIFVKWFRRIATDIRDKQISGVILDIGTGPGRLPIEIAKHIANVEVIGIDISEDMVKIAKKNAEEEGVTDRVRFKVGSAYNTGFDDYSIDLIVSTGLIHHLREPLNAFNEAYRILKPGGEAWLYDGRKDVTKAEFEETVRSLGIEEDLPLPLWIIELIWPRLHIGYKTEVYISGTIGRAFNESLFKDYDVKKEGAYMRIELKRTLC